MNTEPGSIFYPNVLLASYSVAVAVPTTAPNRSVSTVPTLILCLPTTGLAFPADVSTSPDALMSAPDYEHQGMALMTLMNWSGLLNLTGEGISLYPDVGKLYCLQGYALRKTGRYQEAEESCTIAIGLDPKPARYANRGFALLALGRNGEALADAERALSLNTSHASSYAVKAFALSRMGDPAGALEAIDSALALDPTPSHGSSKRRSWPPGRLLRRTGSGRDLACHQPQLRPSLAGV